MRIRERDRLAIHYHQSYQVRHFREADPDFTLPAVQTRLPLLHLFDEPQFNTQDGYIGFMLDFFAKLARERKLVFVCLHPNERYHLEILKEVRQAPPRPWRTRHREGELLRARRRRAGADLSRPRHDRRRRGAGVTAMDAPAPITPKLDFAARFTGLFDLSGKTAFVPGGTGGLGEAMRLGARARRRLGRDRRARAGKSRAARRRDRGRRQGRGRGRRDRGHRHRIDRGRDRRGP